MSAENTNENIGCETAGAMPAAPSEKEIEVLDLGDYSSGVTDLTVGNPWNIILKFAIPLFIGNIFQLLYSWTDAFVVGITDIYQAGGISATLPIVNLLITAMLGFMAGAIVILGQYFGKKDYESVRKCYVTTIAVLSVITAVISILGFIFARSILNLINIDAVHIEHSVTYLRYYCVGMIFMILYNCLSQVLRSLGNSKVPLYIIIFSATLDIGQNFLFVLVFDMGVMGVAVSTIISQGISVLLLIIYIQMKVPLLRLSGKGSIKTFIKTFVGYIDRKMLKKIMRLATPSTLQQASAVLGFIIINALVNSKGGVYTHAFGLGNRIDELLNGVMMSFGIAISNFVAQNKGKGNIERIRSGYRSTFTVSLLVIIGFSALILLSKDFFIYLFTISEKDPNFTTEARSLTATYMNIVLPFYFLMSIMVFSTSALRGAGDAKAAMSVNLFSLFIRVTCAFLFTGIVLFSMNVYAFGFIETNFPDIYPFFRDYGIFFASPCGWLAGSVVGVVRFKRGRWKNINVMAK